MLLTLQRTWRGFTKRTQIGIAIGVAAVLLIIVVAALSANSRDERSYQRGYTIGSGEPFYGQGFTIDGLLQAGLPVEPDSWCQDLVDGFLILDRPDRKGYDRNDMFAGCVDALEKAPQSRYSAAFGNGDTRRWVLTPCGWDNCLNLDTESTLQGQASLIADRWTLTVSRPDAVRCSDGSRASGTTSVSWSATTLRGVLQSFSDQGSCGNPAGTAAGEVTFSLTRVS